MWLIQSRGASLDIEEGPGKDEAGCAERPVEAESLPQKEFVLRMQTDTVLVVERVFQHHRTELFQAFIEPAKLAQWFAPKGWHVLPESVEIDPKVGGRLRHTKVRDDGSGQPWVVDGVYTEVFYPDVLVTRQRITGVAGIDPAKPVELRLEFTKMGRDDTLLKVVQGPYTQAAAMDYSDGWESILDRLNTFLSMGARA